MLTCVYKCTIAYMKALTEIKQKHVKSSKCWFSLNQYGKETK